MVPTRRRLLGSTAAVAAGLAGCQSFGTGCTHERSLRLERSTVADTVARNTRAPDEMHPVAGRLVRRAHEDGAARYRSVKEPPVQTYVYVPFDGTYHAIDLGAVERTTATGYEFDVEMDAEATPGSGESAVAFEDLAAHDRRAFRSLIGFPHPRKLEGATAMSGSGTVAFADASLVEPSVLVPTPEDEYVEYRGNYYHLAETGTTETTVTTYEVTLEAVASSDEALAVHVRDTHGVSLRSSELSTEEREILEEAAAGEYSECDEFSPAFERLRDRLGDASYAKYEGTWYRVELGETIA